MPKGKRGPRTPSPIREELTATVKSNIRRWHDARQDLSDKALADAIGLDPVTVRRWKNDDNDATPQVADAARLCKVFGRSLGELLRPADVPEPADDSAKLARSILGIP
jgi:transcriptional regulator with XRE-family HTH domain